MNSKNLIRAGLFAALLAVFAQIAIPFPGMPLTLQTFGAALAGACLGAKSGTLSVAVYLLLGGVGLPVFSAFTGGFSRLIGPSGGFLWGFLLLACCCGLPLKGAKKWGLTAGGLILCHLAGLLQFALITDCSLLAAFLTASLPYLLKDAFSVALAQWVSKKLQKIKKRY